MNWRRVVCFFFGHLWITIPVGDGEYVRNCPRCGATESFAEIYSYTFDENQDVELTDHQFVGRRVRFTGDTLSPELRGVEVWITKQEGNTITLSALHHPPSDEDTFVIL